jgi:hypothetical protein
MFDRSNSNSKLAVQNSKNSKSLFLLPRPTCQRTRTTCSTVCRREACRAVLSPVAHPPPEPRPEAPPTTAEAPPPSPDCWPSLPSRCFASQRGRFALTSPRVHTAAADRRHAVATLADARPTAQTSSRTWPTAPQLLPSHCRAYSREYKYSATVRRWPPLENSPPARNPSGPRCEMVPLCPLLLPELPQRASHRLSSPEFADNRAAAIYPLPLRRARFRPPPSRSDQSGSTVSFSTSPRTSPCSSPADWLTILPSPRRTPSTERLHPPPYVAGRRHPSAGSADRPEVIAVSPSSFLH